MFAQNNDAERLQEPQAMDVDAGSNSSLRVYYAPSDSYSVVDTSALTEKSMEDDNDFASLVDREFNGIKSPPASKKDLNSVKQETDESIAAYLKDVLNPSSVYTADNFLDKYLPPATAGDDNNNKPRNPDNVLAFAVGAAQDSKTRAVQNVIVNSNTDVNCVGIDRDEYGMERFDTFGRPLFSKRLFVATRSLADTISNVVVMGSLPAQMQNFEMAERLFVSPRDIIVPAYPIRVTMERLPANARVASLYTDAKHSEFLRNLMRSIGNLRDLEAETRYMVSVRFDVGAEAGKSGFDMLAPHLYLEFFEAGKRAAAKDSSDGGAPPKKPKSSKANNKRNPSVRVVDNTTATNEQDDESPDGKRMKMSVAALNGSFELSSRTVKESFEDDATESRNGVSINVNHKYMFLLGRKSVHETVRFAETLIENVRRNTRADSRVYLGESEDEGVFNFESSEPPQNVDTNVFADFLEQTVNAALHRQVSPDAYGFSELSAPDQDPSMWHAMAYVQLIPIDKITEGEKAIAGMMETLTSQRMYEIYFPLKEVINIEKDGDTFRNVSISRFLNPLEALEHADAYESGTYALPCTRHQGKVFDEITEFAKASKRPIWRTARSWVKDMLKLKENKTTFEREALMFFNNIPLVTEALAIQINEYSIRLEKEYMQTERVRFSASYLHMCASCARGNVGVLGNGTAVGDLFSVLMLREAAFLNEYTDRAFKTANAMMESLQLFSFLKDPPVGLDGENWYMNVTGELVEFLKEEEREDAKERIMMQVRKTENEKQEAWEWLRDFGKMLHDYILTKGVVDRATFRKDMSFASIFLYEKLDNSVQTIVQYASRANANDRLYFGEIVRLGAYVGIDVLKSVTEKFEPVLFLSLCHPGEYVLQEATPPSYALDEFDDEAYLPQTKKLQRPEPNAASDGAGAQSADGTGCVPSNRPFVGDAATPDLLTVREYVEMWNSCFLAYAPPHMRDGATAMMEIASNAREKQLNNTFVKVTADTIANAVQKVDGKPNNPWMFALYEALYGEAFSIDTLLPTYDSAKKTEIVQQNLERQPANVQLRFAFIVLLRFVFNVNRASPNDAAKTNADNKSLWQSDQNNSKFGRGSLVIMNALKERFVGDQAQKRAFLSLYTNSKRDRDAKLEGNGHSGYKATPNKPDAVDERVFSEFLMATGNAVPSTKKLLVEAIKKARDTFGKQSSFEDAVVGGKTKLTVSHFDVIVDLIGIAREMANASPGLPHARLYNEVIGSANVEGSNIRLILDYYDMRWSNPKDSLMASVKTVASAAGSSSSADAANAAVLTTPAVVPMDVTPPSAPAVADGYVPGPEGPQNIVISKTRKALLSVHNMIDRMATKCVSSNVAKERSNTLPDHTLTFDDDSKTYTASLSSETNSTLLERINSRRVLMETSRTSLNGRRHFNWVAPDVEHLRSVLDNKDRWGVSYTFENRKNIYTFSRAGRRENESLLPVADDLPYDKDASSNTDGIEHLRRDLRRWSWLLEFTVHDASFFGKKSFTFEEALRHISPARSSRRLVVEADTAHSTMSILAETGLTTKAQHVYTNGVSNNQSLEGSSLIDKIKFHPDQLISVFGANTVSDRMFVSNGFLDKHELIDIYESVVAENAGVTWLPEHIDLRNRETVTNEELMKIRMSTRHNRRFKQLCDALKVLSTAHYNNGGSSSGSTNAHVQNAFNVVSTKGGIAYADKSTTGADLVAHKHLQFGNASKCSPWDADEAKKTKQYARRETLPTNERFLHLYDMNESMTNDQRFCPYKFDDLSCHAVDVMDRVKTVLGLFFSNAQISQNVKFSAFLSLEKTVDVCKVVLQHISKLRSWCAVAKLMMMSEASAEFDRIHQRPLGTRWGKHCAWLSSQTEYTYVGDTLRRNENALQAAITSIDKRMALYHNIGVQTNALRIEATFLKRLGDALYKKASTNTNQRVVNSSLKSMYVDFVPYMFSEERVPASEASDELPLVIANTHKSIVVPSNHNLRNGWGCLYTVGGTSGVLEAFTGRGNLYQDARYSGDYKTNIADLPWSTTDPLRDCNTDFGLYSLYSEYLKTLATDEVEPMEVEGQEDDTGDVSMHSGQQSINVSGTAFQHWASTNILSNSVVRKQWRSVERLPTYAEIVSQLDYGDWTLTDCFDGLETAYMPDMSEQSTKTLFLGLVPSVNAAGWNKVRGLQLSTLKLPFETLTLQKTSFLDGETLLISKETELAPYERTIVRDLALVLSGISSKDWKSWTRLDDKTVFERNKDIVGMSGQTFELSSIIEDDDEDGVAEDEDNGNDRIATTRNDNGDDVENGSGSGARRRAGGAGGNVRGGEGGGGGVALGGAPARGRAGEMAGQAASSRADEFAMRKAAALQRREDHRKRVAESIVAQNRAALEEIRRQGNAIQNLEQRRQNQILSSECPRSVLRVDFDIVETDITGDCFYDAVSKVLGQYNMHELRKRASDFFVLDFGPNVLEEDWDHLFNQFTAIMTNLAIAINSNSPETDEFVTTRNNVYEYALTQNYSGLGSEYSEFIENGAWANAPEINAIGQLLKAKICVYRYDRDNNITLSGGELGPPSGRAVPILWVNENEPLKQHFVGLRIFNALPVTDGMDTTAAATPAFIRWNVKKTDESYECIYEAVSNAQKFYNHSNVATAESIQREVSAIHKLASKHMASASLQKPPPLGLQALPYATNCNIIIYDALSGQEHDNVYGIGAAYSPLPCAYQIRLLRRETANGKPMYTVA
jgi:hypothetical protein